MILVAGEPLIDLVPRAGAENVYEAILGGSPYNVAIGLGRLRAPVSFVARLSQDANGDRFTAALVRDGVDLRYVERVPEPSALALVAPGTAASGPRYAFYLRGTAYDGRPPFPDVWPEDARHLHVGSIAAMEGISGETTLAAMKAAKGRLSTSFDPNIRPLIIPPRAEVLPLVEDLVRLATVVKASEEDLEWLYPDRAPAGSAAEWAGWGPQLVVVTRGSAGAEAWVGREHFAVSAPKVAVVDTIGAGDSFMAALLAIMRADGAQGAHAPRTTSDGARTWVEYACRAAAITCSRKGADPPRLEELAEG